MALNTPAASTRAPNPSQPIVPRPVTAAVAWGPASARWTPGVPPVLDCPQIGAPVSPETMYEEPGASGSTPVPVEAGWPTETITSSTPSPSASPMDVTELDAEEAPRPLVVQVVAPVAPSTFVTVRPSWVSTKTICAVPFEVGTACAMPAPSIVPDQAAVPVAPLTTSTVVPAAVVVATARSGTPSPVRSLKPTVLPE